MKSRNILAPIVACGIAASCSGTRHEGIPGPNATFTETSTVIDGNFNANGSSWHIVCEGPMTPVRADRKANTLVKLIFSHTDIREPANLETPNISTDAIAQAVARADGIPNRNLIMDGNYYNTPSACQLGEADG